MKNKNNKDKLNMKVLRVLGLLLILFDYTGDTLNFYNFFAKPLVSGSLYKVGGTDCIVFLLFILECIYLVGRYVLKVKINWSEIIENEKNNFINNLLVEKIQEESNVVYNLLNSYVLPHIYKQGRVLVIKACHMLIYIKEKYYYVNIY
ncbi:hypothetical protein IR152_03590 [Clostridioides sp. ES-S-0108-01]|uniref:hypothetical protein n=1 Tax=Clostridioides sp. ES-S-0108-01 TaxID=2770773 RepID=UPI001D0C654E|nr:hypothetical protein [Clostridioides sp. ES-S-0108-01]UDN51920.1 hypothetical protein JJC16_04405 [Clostridioides sp. ES-S-0107-01]